MKRRSPILLLALLPAFASALVPAPKPITELGGVIEFPSINEMTPADAPKWDAAEAAAKEMGATFRAIQPTGDIWLRTDALFHESAWDPMDVDPRSRERLGRIAAICKRTGLSPNMGVTPHPWATSPWFPPYYPSATWGDGSRFTPLRRSLIATHYARIVAEYLDALKASGIPYSHAALQFGNEPASGHPGGNGLLPRGMWQDADADLWAACNAAARYSTLNVISPAISMDDQPQFAQVERDSAAKGRAKWQYPVGGIAFHNRVFRNDLAGDAYAAEYLRVTADRAGRVLASWDGLKTTKGRAATRAAGAWITEAYVAEGDCGGDRAEAVAAIFRRIATEGIPNVRVFTLYRFYPEEGADAMFSLKAASKSALRAAGEAMKAARVKGDRG